MNEEHTISFCIVCMNRLHHLKETLLRNIQDNEDYKKLEFVLLNYNSQDSMDDWVRSNLHEYISSGKLKYYKTCEPAIFSHSHSKNLMFKLATGDIVCNINADHFTGKGFAVYINEVFTADKNIVLTPIDFYRTRTDYYPPVDTMGRVCVLKKDFLKVRGFDERMKLYGHEDAEFVNRLETAGVKRMLIEDFSFLQYISHPNEERVELNECIVENIYIHYGSPAWSEIIFLLNNQQFEKCAVISNAAVNSVHYTATLEKRGYWVEVSIDEPGVEKGSWQKNGDTIHFYSEAGSYSYTEKETDDATLLQNAGTDKVYYLMRNAESIQEAIRFQVLAPNLYILEKNLKERIIEVNTGEFGKATVFKNFHVDPIYIT